MPTGQSTFWWPISSLTGSGALLFHLQGMLLLLLSSLVPVSSLPPLSHGWMQCPHRGLTTTREDLMIWLGATQGAAPRGQQCPGPHAVLLSCAPSSGRFEPLHGWDALSLLSLGWLISYSDRGGSERSSPDKTLGSVIKMPIRMLQFPYCSWKTPCLQPANRGSIPSS